jgi:hypothetical protein
MPSLDTDTDTDTDSAAPSRRAVDVPEGVARGPCGRPGGLSQGARLVSTDMCQPRPGTFRGLPVFIKVTSSGGGDTIEGTS